MEEAVKLHECKIQMYKNRHFAAQIQILRYFSITLHAWGGTHALLRATPPFGRFRASSFLARTCPGPDPETKNAFFQDKKSEQKPRVAWSSQKASR
jgi:hypothetical protein